jgi:hypothetical protein
MQRTTTQRGQLMGLATHLHPTATMVGLGKRGAACLDAEGARIEIQGGKKVGGWGDSACSRGGQLLSPVIVAGPDLCLHPATMSASTSWRGATRAHLKAEPPKPVGEAVQHNIVMPATHQGVGNGGSPR